MVPATTREAEAWRRLVWWSRVTGEMPFGCSAAVLLFFVGVLAVWLFEVPHLVIAAVVLAVVTEVVRRICDALRRRALDAAVLRLEASYGLSREALEQAASQLTSGRLEELAASVAFDGDPLRQAIEGALARAGVSLAPLCGSGEGARAVVVSLGWQWAAVLRFAGAELVAAHVHRRRFAWHDGAGPRPIELSLDAETRALVERSLARLPGEGVARDDEPPWHVDEPVALSPEGEGHVWRSSQASDVGPHIGQAQRVGERAVRVGFAIVDGEGRVRTRAGVIELGEGAPARADAGHGGPYRTTGPAAPGEVVEIEVEEQLHRLAPARSDGPAENVLVHAVVHAAARVVRPFVLVPRVLIIKGRPLRVDGVPRVAELRRDATWIAALAPVPAGDPAQRAELAQRWLHAALIEHASIAAFERLARVLAELGAPTSLIERARAAIAEEDCHARDAFSLAAAYGGPEWGPGTLAVPDEPTPAIDALALETFVDGCVGETSAAREAAAALVRCEVPAVRAALERVASDERRHAELAWDILAWLLPRTSKEGRQAIAAVSPRVGSTPGEEPSFARHGWLTRAEEQAVVLAAWREEIGPRRAALLGTRRSC